MFTNTVAASYGQVSYLTYCEASVRWIQKLGSINLCQVEGDELTILLLEVTF